MNVDTLLLSEVRNKNNDTLMQVFVHYAPALYTYVYRLSHNAKMADQIVGDVFSKLLEHVSSGRGPALNMRSYLFEIAYHLVLDEARYSQRRAPLDAFDLTLSDGSSIQVSAENRILFETVRRAIVNDLTPDQRHIIVLRFLEEFSVKETALITGKTVVNVKVIQNRAIAVLRRAMDYQVINTGDITLMIRNMSHTQGA
jgi:RNA polymerase sigma-70 factor (ECF subfamily)